MPRSGEPRRAKGSGLRPRGRVRGLRLRARGRGTPPGGHRPLRAAPGERAHHRSGREATRAGSREGLRRHRPFRQHLRGLDPHRAVRRAGARSCPAGRHARVRGLRRRNDLGRRRRGMVLVLTVTTDDATPGTRSRGTSPAGRSRYRVMRQLKVKLSAKQHETLRRHAARLRTPIAWLIKDYIATLVDDQEAENVRTHEPTQVAARGGSFAWLSDEPDVYAATDGEPIPTRAPRRR